MFYALFHWLRIMECLFINQWNSLHGNEKNNKKKNVRWKTQKPSKHKNKRRVNKPYHIFGDSFFAGDVPRQ